ncbi:alkaline phosphatase family protein [bacterium]|nr:alkaline phosphatase family protein [bacterium]
MKKRVIRVGIDGASFTRLQTMADEGVMPFLGRLRQAGTLRRLMASIPDNSAVSWSSIMTGKNPGEHGIFGFTDLIPGTYTMRFPNFRNLKAAPFWRLEPEKRHVVINLPFSYPADGISGRMVSGFISPNLENAASPPEFLEYLKARHYRIDADTRKIYQSRALFYEDLMAVHEIRCRVYREQFSSGDWDTFMIVFTGSDRIGHYLLDAWEDPGDPDHERFLEYFRAVDRELAWIMEHAGADDIVVMMSDHGMERVKKEVNLNYLLETGGFLSLADTGKRGYTAIADGTKAFVLEPSRVHLNYTGRYPGGTVTAGDRQALLEELKALFRGLTCEGEPVIREMFPREELYSGPALEEAPDLLLVPHTGYSLRGTLARDELFTEPDTLVGMHRGDDAFLYVHGREHAGAVPEHPRVEDIQSIVEKIL